LSFVLPQVCPQSITPRPAIVVNRRQHVNTSRLALNCASQ
jgi:hypothetical protein